MRWLIIIILASAPTCEVTNEIVRIEIRKVDFEISTFYSIGCDNFEESFSDEVVTINIKSQNDLIKFSSYLTNIKDDMEGYIPDVRVKILIYYSNNDCDTLCMSELGMMYNNKAVLFNEDIMKFVKSH